MIKYPMEIDNIVNKIIAKIKTLPDGTETSISQLMYDLLIIKSYDRSKNVYIGDNFEIITKDMFLINKEVIERAENEGIFLDFSKYVGKMVGLLFNISFVKRTISS
jgi:hypothetical protein